LQVPLIWVHIVPSNQITMSGHGTPSAYQAAVQQHFEQRNTWYNPITGKVEGYTAYTPMGMAFVRAQPATPAPAHGLYGDNAPRSGETVAQWYARTKNN
jgi:hypothetical protein